MSVRALHARSEFQSASKNTVRPNARQPHVSIYPRLTSSILPRAPLHERQRATPLPRKTKIKKKKKQSKNKRTHRLRLHLALAPHSWPSRIALTPFGEGTTKTTSGPIKSEPVLTLTGYGDKVEIGVDLRWPRSLQIVYYDSVVRVGTIHKIPLVVFGRVHSWVVAPRSLLLEKERTNELSAPMNAWRRFGMSLF